MCVVGYFTTLSGRQSQDIIEYVFFFFTSTSSSHQLDVVTICASDLMTATTIAGQPATRYRQGIGENMYDGIFIIGFYVELLLLLILFFG